MSLRGIRCCRAEVGFPFCEGQGTFLWAEFTLAPAGQRTEPPAGVVG